MKTRSLLLASIAVTGLLTGCGSYPLGVPLGLTRAEINALPPAKRTAVLKAYQQTADRERHLALIGAPSELDSSRPSPARELVALESLSRTNDLRDTSPGAVK
jgi:hypothetical protein